MNSEEFELRRKSSWLKGSLKGGVLLGCVLQNREILRIAKAEWAAPTDTASFPLIPFSNRIARGCFSYGSHDVALPTEGIAPPNAIHGLGWTMPWTLETLSPERVIISHENKGGDWPWAYRAEQIFTLFDHEAEMTLRLTNMSDETMPAGLGFHPYFPQPDKAEVTMATRLAHTTEETLLPIARDTGHPALAAFRTGQPLTRNLDTVFELDEPGMTINWPGLGYGCRIDAPGLDYAVVYSPAGADYFCLEPVSHCTNAVNLDGTSWGATGLVHLKPGDTMKAEVTLSLI